jgi:long-chain acyl-CoA synthetase
VLSKVRATFFGARLKYAFSGGAAISREVAEFIDNIGVTVYEGYGLTETSPIATANCPAGRKMGSVGRAIPGTRIVIDREITGDPKNGEIIVHGHNVMQGYYNLPEENAKVFTGDGGFRTGDMGYLDDEGFLIITGRIKEIIVLGNGEKVPPVDMELSIQLDPLFEQVLIFGEAQPYLTALVVLNDEEWARFAAENQLSTVLIGENREKAEKLLVKRLGQQIKHFPGYAQVRKLTVVSEKWTIDNGFMTPTLKLKRNAIAQKYQAAIDEMYKGFTL